MHGFMYQNASTASTVHLSTLVSVMAEVGSYRRPLDGTLGTQSAAATDEADKVNVVVAISECELSGLRDG